MEAIKESTVMEGKKRETFSKTIEKNGNRKTIRVEEVENGYVVSIEKYMDDKWTEKKYISSDNPFDKKEEISPDENMMSESKFGGMLDL